MDILQGNQHANPEDFYKSLKENWKIIMIFLRIIYSNLLFLQTRQNLLKFTKFLMASNLHWETAKAKMENTQPAISVHLF
jgi:hypothetical protein